jgi:hypothetical protein
VADEAADGTVADHAVGGTVADEHADVGGVLLGCAVVDAGAGEIPFASSLGLAMLFKSTITLRAFANSSSTAISARVF